MLKATPHDRKTRNSSLGISASWVSWRTETKMTSWGSRRRVCRYRTYAMRVLRFQRSIPVGWLLGRYLQCVHSCEDTHNSLHSFFFFFTSWILQTRLLHVMHSGFREKMLSFLPFPALAACRRTVTFGPRHCRKFVRWVFCATSRPSDKRNKMSNARFLARMSMHIYNIYI